MSIWDKLNDPTATWVRPLRPDGGERWSVLEPGVLVENDYPEKYDARVLFPPRMTCRTAEQQAAFDEADGFVRALLSAHDRVFYFFADEIEYVAGPGFDRWKPADK